MYVNSDDEINGTPLNADFLEIIYTLFVSNKITN